MSALKRFRSERFGSSTASVGELNQFEDELEEIAKDLGRKLEESRRTGKHHRRMVEIVAHDLRTPLGVIQGYLRLLQSSVFGKLSDDAQNVFQIMERNCTQMLSLVNGLLDTTALETTNLRLDTKPMPIDDLLRECIERNRLSAEEKGVLLRLRQDEELPMVRVDEDRIRQVLDNLLTNGIKFSRPGDSVTVGASQQGDAIEVFVSDSGCGIPKDEVDVLFAPFSRTSSKPPRGEKCFGLGLAIAKKMVEAHGGEIHADSNVGEGSVFTFTLPLS